MYWPERKFQMRQRLYNIFFICLVFINLERRKQEMSGSSSSQSQATYPHSIKEKPPIEVLVQNISSATDQESVSKFMIKLAEYMRGDQQHEFQTGLKGISFILEKGYSSILMTYSDLMRKMMNYFTKLGKSLEDQTADYSIQVRMLYVLSIIAELIRQNPKFYFPFTRKFLMTMFRIDNEMLIKSPKRKDILAILAVIYQNLSRQGRLVNKYNITNDLKRALLQNYELIQELFSMKVFNKAIANLVTKGVSFSVADFTKYKVLETLSNFISKSEVQLFVIKMKMTMLLLKGQGQPAQGINHSSHSAFCMSE